MKINNRVTWLILDSVGIGDAPDAAAYGDEGSNTLGNISRAVNGLHLPNMGALGLGNICRLEGVPPVQPAKGAFGRLTETCAGKDTTSGHWEMAGVPLTKPFPVYPHGFPIDLLDELTARTRHGWMGNIVASGTEIIKTLGEEHVRTGKMIVYTSADSVFQVAAHEEVVPLPELYAYCEAARQLLVGDHAVGRVIARPFTGSAGDFTRTENRRDYSLLPPKDTVLDAITKAGLDVMAVGKIEDIYAHRGITRVNHTKNNMAGVDGIIGYLRSDYKGLIVANLVDFDALYGHRNNPQGYAKALEEFDVRLPEIIQAMQPQDILFITADHGNDPTTPSTDHSRERVPLLAAGPAVRPGVDIGTRASFSDLAATTAELLHVPWRGAGRSFASLIRMS